jgi:hypothetical protein
MDPLHPVEPLQLDAGLNGYLNFVNDHSVARTIVSVLAFIGLAPYPVHSTIRWKHPRPQLSAPSGIEPGGV